MIYLISLKDFSIFILENSQTGKNTYNTEDFHAGELIFGWESIGIKSKLDTFKIRAYKLNRFLRHL